MRSFGSFGVRRPKYHFPARIRFAVVASSFLFGAAEASAQFPPVGSIDLYGLRKTPITQVREALGITVGDSLTGLTLVTLPARLAEIPGVMSAAIDPVCCEGGKTMLYVGIAEDGAPELTLRPPPDGASRVAEDIVVTAEALSAAQMRAIRRGIVSEDASEGHSLMSDSTVRALQLRYVEFAARDLDSLRKVLRTSGDAGHRELAAEVLGYAPSKQSVVDDLVFAMRDHSAGVRNAATRALALIAMLGQKRPDLGIRVPYEPFVDMLNSLTWSDRNKASLALMQLTEARDPAMLTALRTRAFDSIVDIARWTNPGHAIPGVFMLARMAGISDGEAFAMSERGETERIIAAAAKLAPAPR